LHWTDNNFVVFYMNNNMEFTPYGEMKCQKSGTFFKLIIEWCEWDNAILNKTLLSTV